MRYLEYEKVRRALAKKMIEANAEKIEFIREGIILAVIERKSKQGPVLIHLSPKVLLFELVENYSRNFSTPPMYIGIARRILLGIGE